MPKTHTKARVVLMLFFSLWILSCLVFIFWNSLLPRDASASLSNGLLSKITAVIGTESALARFIIAYFRKIAHFLEFGFLAVPVAGLGTLLFDFRKSTGYGLLFGLLTAVTDESLQILSARGSSTLDVLLDFSGYLVSTILFTLLFLRIQKRLDRKEL